ncbi:OmpA family protein [Photobacterium phosphoreum]|uniref:OmpA family protein n=1 Tax=Photobacterium phosphoreum TaxID=659 RepID=UPI0015E6B54D|nr:OmpA family protein [Photobacterium phosphoreum]
MQYNKKKKTNLNLLMFCTFPLISLNVFASETVTLPNDTNYPSAWVSGNFGISNINTNSKLNTQSLPTLKIVSGYDFNPYIGLYSSYDYINSKNKDVNILSLGFKGNLPIFDAWSIFGKIGISYLNNQGKQYNVSGSTGLGVEYKITNSISTQIGYDYYQNMDVSKSTFSLNQLYWGMTYRFGQPILPIIKAREVDVIHNIDSKVMVLSRENYIITFGNGQYSLDRLDKITLNNVLTIMHTYPHLTAKIIGRADKIGHFLINEKISQNRALSAYQYLIKNGVSSSRLSKKAVSNISPLSDDSSNNSELERSVQIILK